MKSIKILGLFLAILIVGPSFYSCSKEEYESRIKELILSDMTFSSSASTAIQKFRQEDLGNYAIKSGNTTWCNAIIRKDSNQIVVSVTENTSYDERKAVVTLTDLIDTTMTRTFNVTQAQMDAIEVDKENTYFDVKTSGGQVTVKFKTNVSFSVDIDENNVDWISQKASASTRGLQDTSIVLNVAKNTSGDERRGYVYIVSKKDSEDKVTITIDQQFEASLRVDTTKLSIDELGGTVKVTVTANISYDVYSQSDWITKSSSKETSDSTTTESFKVEEFTEKKKSRTGYVIIENAAYDDMQQKIKITQTRALYIDDTNDISVDVGKTVQLTLTNTTGDDNVTWTSSSKNIATVSSDGTVTGVAAGTATITVTSSDEEHTYSVKVVVNEAKEEESSGDSSSE
jgi:uncharacterized protein YjdB